MLSVYFYVDKKRKYINKNNKFLKQTAVSFILILSNLTMNLSLILFLIGVLGFVLIEKI